MMTAVVEELLEKYSKELHKKGYRLEYVDNMANPNEMAIRICLGNYNVQIPVKNYLFEYSFQYVRNKIELAIPYLDKLREENEKNENTTWHHNPCPTETEIYGGESCTTN